MPILTVGSIFAIFAVLPYYKTEKVVSAEAPEAVAEPEAQAEAPEAVAESEENAKVEYDFTKGI